MARKGGRAEGRRGGGAAEPVRWPRAAAPGLRRPCRTRAPLPYMPLPYAALTYACPPVRGPVGQRTRKTGPRGVNGSPAPSGIR